MSLMKACATKFGLKSMRTPTSNLGVTGLRGSRKLKIVGTTRAATVAIVSNQTAPCRGARCLVGHEIQRWVANSGTMLQILCSCKLLRCYENRTPRGKQLGLAKLLNFGGNKVCLLHVRALVDLQIGLDGMTPRCAGAGKAKDNQRNSQCVSVLTEGFGMQL